MIIDGGSIDNLVSIEMVNKSQLVCVPKYNPYKISWLKKDHSVLADKSCLVAFKIGPYVDEVLCDVVLMDAWHFLLGRLWQYDQNVVHQGRENTYEVQHEGRKTLLKPWKEEGASEVVALSLLVESKFELEEKNKILAPPRREMEENIGAKEVNYLKNEMQPKIDVELQQDSTNKITCAPREKGVEVLVDCDLHS